MLLSLLPLLPLLGLGVEVAEKDESTLLQSKGEVKWLDFHAGGFPIYMDFKTKNEARRKRFPAQASESLGAPYEMAFRFKDLEKQGFVVNATHAVFPMGHMVQAQFVRKNGPLQTLEFGVANMRWQPKIPNLPSMMEYVVVAAEKDHILYHKGPWPDDSYKYALEDQEKQMSSDDELLKPSDVRMAKSVEAFLVNLVGRLGIEFARAGTDPVDVSSVADLSGKPAPKRFSRMCKKLQKTLSRNNARITRKVKSKVTPEGTGTGCFHLQDSKQHSSPLPPVTLTPDGESGFAVRLDTLVQSFRGDITFAPVDASSITRGGMVLSHDEEKNELRVYHQSSSLFRAEDIDGTHLDSNPTFYLGSLTPRLGALWRDARTSMPAPSDDKHALLKSYLAKPMDYTHMFNATCVEGGSDGKYAKAMEALSSLNTMEFMRALGDASIPEADRKRTLLAIATMMAEQEDCMAGWLRSSVVNSHGFDLNAASVMVHMMTEFRPAQLADITLDPKWNSLDLLHDGEE